MTSTKGAAAASCRAPAMLPQPLRIAWWPLKLRLFPVTQKTAMNPPLRSESLSPAATLKSMRYAFAYGADAVYAGQPRYSVRARNNEFDPANLKPGIAEAHALGQQVSAVVNLAPHNAKLRAFSKDRAPVVAMGPDALVVSVPGLMRLVREHC